jgi:predicted RNA binding protein YcfA (HicA-like mRNA interferase family)
VGLSISGIEMRRVLERYGWRLDREGAKHWLMFHPDRPGVKMTVERHRSDIAIGTLHRMLKQADLTEDQVRRAK